MIRFIGSFRVDGRIELTWGSEWGWEMFQSFHQHCKIPTGGYASIRDVDQVPVVFEDNMETFWIVCPPSL